MEEKEEDRPGPTWGWGSEARRRVVSKNVADS